MQSTEKLIQQIRQKHQTLVQLRDVGRRQMDLVMSGDTASLLKLLAVKQQLISALQELERELTPRYAEDPEAREWRSPEERARCATQSAECNALLQEIVKLEKASADKMAIRRNEVAEQLRHVHEAGQVRTAYQAQQRTRPVGGVPNVPTTVSSASPDAVR